MMALRNNYKKYEDLKKYIDHVEKSIQTFKIGEQNINVKPIQSIKFGNNAQKVF